jgi:hypothetical protein
MVVLKTCTVVMFFISGIQSELSRFKFTVSWLCDDHIAADWRISRSWIVLPHIFELSNQPTEARMSDLGLQPRKVWKQSDRLLAE